MMTTQPPHNTIEAIVTEAGSVFETAQNIPGLLESSSQYRSFLEKITDIILSDKLRIAVVGVIKSGKSTFVNAFLGKELVKRGAGVVTSITTRIQKGKKNQALLYLRSWDEINAELRKSLLPGPDDVKKDSPKDFDIRRKKDRERLGAVYQKLIQALSSTHEAGHPEIFSIRHALQGFDAVKNLVEPDETVICFESQEFEKYKEYTSDPDKAFYIKDVCLSVPVKRLDSHMELADCQGADSTDPSQRLRILAYLESSNLMIYCISSRTGVRESDLIFLKQIKNMGLLGNIVFINNCDLTEHESLEDLLKIEADIRKDLCLLGIEPELYSFSLLYSHFANMQSKISKKDKFRFESWQKEKEMIQYCDLKSHEFDLQLKDKIDKNRHNLLISNPMKRILCFLGELKLRIHIFLDLLSSEAVKEEKARKAVSVFYQNAYRLETLVTDSLENAVQGLKKEIDTHVHQMFAQDKDAVLSDIREYLSLLSTETESVVPHGREAGFNEALFLIFKELQRRVDLYVLEAVNPLLKKFITLQEERILSFFQSLSESYHLNLLPVDHYFDPKDLFLLENHGMMGFDEADMDEIKKILGIQLPTELFGVQYTSKMKTRIMAGFGLKTLLSHFLSSLFNKQTEFSFVPVLKKATQKIKTGNREIFKKQFEKYGADLKIHYFLPLIDAAARDFKEKTNERLKQYQALNTKMEQSFSLKQSEKEDQKALVLSLKQRIEKLMDSIGYFAEG